MNFNRRSIRVAFATALLSIAFAPAAHTQVSNLDRAKAHFLQAEIEYEQAKYENALKQVSKAKEIFGKTTPTLAILEIRILDKLERSKELDIAIDSFLTTTPPPSENLKQSIYPILARLDDRLEAEKNALDSINVAEEAKAAGLSAKEQIENQASSHLSNLGYSGTWVDNSSPSEPYKTEVKMIAAKFGIREISCDATYLIVTANIKVKAASRRVGLQDKSSFGEWYDNSFSQHAQISYKIPANVERLFKKNAILKREEYNREEVFPDFQKYVNNTPSPSLQINFSDSQKKAFEIAPRKFTVHFHDALCGK